MKTRPFHSGRHAARAAGIALAAILVSSTVHAQSTASAGASALSPNAAAIQANIQNMLSTSGPSSIVPLSDIPGGAASATITEASLFAWQEFIALSWPNVPVTGSLGTRETADGSKQFGQPAGAYLVNGQTAAYPALVWETLRNKPEIYGGLTSNSMLLPPNGYVNNADLDFGFDAFPQYNYANGISPGYGYNGSTKPAPFVNLDENSQIGTCQMFAGLPAGDGAPTQFPGRLVLFLAKASRKQYNYVSSRQWWNTNSSAVGLIENNTSGYVLANQKLPPPGAEFGTPSNPGPYISFPNGTIEVKAAWRLLTTKETAVFQQTGQVPGYHWAMVRYYPVAASDSQPTTNPGALVADPTKPVDAPAVLLGLHIIQKTPSAPYFIFATFEHVSNIRNQSGNAVEDQNGGLTPNAYSATVPTQPPAGYVLQGDVNKGNPPPGQYLKDPTTSNVFTQFATAGSPEGEIFVPNETTGSTGVGPGGSSSYYINTQKSGLPADNIGPPTPTSTPYLDVNRRRFLIPNEIVNINRSIHGLISTYGYQQAANIWLNYRLTNVQWKPVNKPSGQALTTAINGVPPASYYQSNSMIETNIVLSGFSGQFAGQSNNITDYYFAPVTYTDTTPTPATTVVRNASTAAVPSPFYNVYHAGTANNMGGCMGCHGNRSVGVPPHNGATDFSFIFDGGPVANHDQAKFAFTPAEMEALRLKLHNYFRQ
ncbi:MAG TPA: hypothetical protein VMC06_12085 [Opitutaceae bacterium]|nr:hypothetical protein [Opitutaceae bacterium]